MNADDLAKQIQTMRRRVNMLYRAAGDPPPQQETLAQAFEELQAAHEELLATEEELRRKNEEMLDMRAELEQQTQRYRELFEHAPEGYLVSSLDGTIRQANQIAAALLKTSERFLIGRSLALFIPEGERRPFRTEMARLREIGRRQDWEVRFQPWNGAPFEASLTVAVVSGNMGRPLALRWILRDISARRRREADLRERLARIEQRSAAGASSAPAAPVPAEGVETVRPHYAFLVDASLLLAVAHDDSALARVAELAVPAFADLCVVDLIEDGGQVHRLAAASTGAIHDMFGGALDKPGGRDYAVPPGIARVLKSGEPHLVPSAWDLTPLIRARAAGRAAVEHEFAPLSWMIVPLQARGQVLGAITCISVEAHHRYAAADLALAQELAQRAAIAVDRARMYREAR